MNLFSGGPMSAIYRESPPHNIDQFKKVRSLIWKFKSISQIVLLIKEICRIGDSANIREAIRFGPKPMRLAQKYFTHLPDVGCFRQGHPDPRPGGVQWVR